MIMPYDQKGKPVTSTTTLQENFRRVQAKISTLCTNAGQERASGKKLVKLPRLIVASKGRDAEAIATLYAQGQREFGENFTSELEQKTKQLQHLAINWVYIGVLQSNKIARLVRLCDEIQSLASHKHARYVERYAAQYGKQPFPVYLAVNIGNEPQKQGFSAAEVVAAAKEIAHKCPHLQVEGIMTVPPSIYCDRDWQQPPPAYHELRRLASCCGHGKLSLGMSADLALALHADTDCVRIGRDFFTGKPDDKSELESEQYKERRGKELPRAKRVDN